eukprot:780218_1
MAYRILIFGVGLEFRDGLASERFEVPISLYISLELVRAAQARYMEWDVEMYDPVRDVAIRARTSTLNAELGQLRCIFSDKTGTLTRNVMDFNRCTINGISYGPGELIEGSDEPIMRARDLISYENGIPELLKKSRFEDNRILHHLDEFQHAESNRIDEFLTLSANCNTVIPEFPGCSESGSHMHGSSGGVSNASPDEKTLVLAAKEHHYFLYRFASTGQRTLVCASRPMTPAHFSQWYSEHAAVRTALKGRHHLVGESCARAESDLELLAATVIEDLQSMELEI